MIKQMSRVAVIVALVVAAACTKHDANSVTGSTQYTSVQLTNSPSSFTLAKGDSAAFTTTATILPQGLVISNASDNMTFSIVNPATAEINASGYVQGDSVGTTALRITYIDVTHGNTPVTLDVPITVTPAP